MTSPTPSRGSTPTSRPAPTSCSHPASAPHEQIRAVLAELEVPVNVLTVPGAPPVAELAELGVRRISVGASFAFTAYAALADAAGELLTHGTYTYTDDTARGRSLARSAFNSAATQT